MSAGLGRCCWVAVCWLLQKRTAHSCTTAVSCTAEMELVRSQFAKCRYEARPCAEPKWSSSHGARPCAEPKWSISHGAEMELVPVSEMELAPVPIVERLSRQHAITLLPSAASVCASGSQVPRVRRRRAPHSTAAAQAGALDAPLPSCAPPLLAQPRGPAAPRPPSIPLPSPPLRPSGSPVTPTLAA